MKIAPGSLRLRLILLAVIVVVAALLLFGQQLAWLFEQHVERRIHKELINHMNQLIVDLRRDAKSRYHLARPLSDPRFSRPYSGLYWQVNDGKKSLARSRSLWDFALRFDDRLISRDGLHEYTIKGPEGAELFALVRGVWLDIGEGEKRYIFTVALDHGDISAAVADFRRELYISLAVLALVLVLAVWAQVSLGLRPLHLIRRQVSDIRSGRRRRLDPPALAEVRPLTEEINALLSAQEKDIERNRARAGDLAHGMKTPLAILAAQARRLEEGGHSETAREIRHQLQILRRHVERELARAKTHGRRLGVMRATPVGEPLASIVRTLESLPRETPITWHLDIDPNLTVPMEKGDFLEMMGNLLENAHKWASRHVTVTSRQDGQGRVMLLVEDDGPGVPEDRFETILRRGERLDESMQGSGLGLAIVQDVLESYGFALQLYSSGMGGLGVCIVTSPPDADRRPPGPGQQPAAPSQT